MVEFNAFLPKMTTFPKTYVRKDTPLFLLLYFGDMSNDSAKQGKNFWLMSHEIYSGIQGLLLKPKTNYHGSHKMMLNGYRLR